MTGAGADRRGRYGRRERSRHRVTPAMEGGRGMSRVARDGIGIVRIVLVMRDAFAGRDSDGMG